MLRHIRIAGLLTFALSIFECSAEVQINSVNQEPAPTTRDAVNYNDVPILYDTRFFFLPGNSYRISSKHSIHQQYQSFIPSNQVLSATIIPDTNNELFPVSVEYTAGSEDWKDISNYVIVHGLDVYDEVSQARHYLGNWQVNFDPLEKFITGDERGLRMRFTAIDPEGSVSSI